jgi:hypothetical protein
MSKVYSFRLNDDNPREVQAREVINAWISKGYSLRHILTEALTSFNETNNPHDGVNDLLDQLRVIIEQSSSLKTEAKGEGKDENPLPLSSTFVSELGKSMKAGIRIDN